MATDGMSMWPGGWFLEGHAVDFSAKKRKEMMLVMVSALTAVSQHGNVS